MAGKARTAALAASVVLGTVLPFAAAAPANAATTCANGSWLAQYYPNTALTGTARKIRCENAAPGYDWALGHPAGITLPNDGFSARWTMKRDFGGGGPVVFKVSGQDGLRLYVDGARKVNLWNDVTRDHGADVTLNLTPGVHTVQLDYFAGKGRADVRLSYAPAAYDTVAPLAVSGFKTAQIGDVDTRVNLSWTPNTELDLAGYRIYRGTRNWNAYQASNLVATLSPLAHSWLDAIPNVQPTTAYAIVAVDRSGNVSPVTTAWLLPWNYSTPLAPNQLQLTGYSSDVTFTWVGGSEDDRYDVYRATSSNGPYTLVGSVPFSMFTDTTGSPTTAYYYKVNDTDTYGNTSPLSAAAGPTALAPN